MSSGVQVARDANPGRIKVVNWTEQTIFVRVTNYTTRGGSVDYLPILPRGEEVWTCEEENGHEGIFFSRDSRGYDMDGCVNAKSGSLVIVYDLEGWTRPAQLDYCNLLYGPCDSPIAVHNASPETVKIFVSSFSRNKSDDSWVDVCPGRTERWDRRDAEMIILSRACDFHDRSKSVCTWMELGEELTIMPSYY